MVNIKLNITRIITVLLCIVASTLFAAGNSSNGLSRIDPPIAAPAFTLEDLDDQSRTMYEFIGKPVIVNFWATWCPPCRKEMPSMERAWQKIQAEGIAMIGINVGEDFDTVFGFTGDIDISFPLLLDTDSSATKKWPIRGLPTTYVVNPQGEIVYQALGERQWDDEDLLDIVRALRNRS